MTKSLQQVTCTNEIGPAIIIVPCAFVFMKGENTFSQAATSQKLPGIWWQINLLCLDTMFYQALGASAMGMQND
jgi:hypothetical protein